MTADPFTLALAGFALLALAHVGTHSMLLKASVGNAWTIGPRDTAATPGPLAARAGRALRNFLETAPAFLALMLAAHAANATGALITIGMAAYLAGRTAYLPAYLSALPWARTACWQIAGLGLALLLVGVLVT
ncbi:MAG: MAPEG family protein [Pararhodobacter sp.]|nr:MAPEG family protein [Pararhodobacter sp.]